MGSNSSCSNLALSDTSNWSCLRSLSVFLNFCQLLRKNERDRKQLQLLVYIIVRYEQLGLKFLSVARNATQPSAALPVFVSFSHS